jgi:hypothetical protein
VIIPFGFGEIKTCYVIFKYILDQYFFGNAIYTKESGKTSNPKHDIYHTLVMTSATTKGNGRSIYLEIIRERKGI